VTRRTLSQILGIVIVLVATPAAALAAGALDRIKQSGVVRIGVPGNFPPFGDLTENAKLEGYDIDTATLIADGLGAKLDLVALASPERIAALTEGKVDLVVSTLGRNPER
jgi:polar amino acid transport system substrate-binding protein